MIGENIFAAFEDKFPRLKIRRSCKVKYLPIK